VPVVSFVPVLTIDNDAVLIATSDSAVNGLTNWSTHYGLTTRTETRYSSNGVRYAKTIAPDDSFTVTRFEDGRVMATARTNSSTQLNATTFAYDEHGRQKFMTDARNGTNTYAFDNLDRVVVSTTPPPASGQMPQTNGYRFDALGRVTAVTNADGAVLYKEYLDSGELKKTSGSRTYPVEYAYDHAGRMKTMTTWQNHASGTGAAVTTWNYHATRGWLAGKRYADPATGGAGNLGPNYAYTSGGRLAFHFSVLHYREPAPIKPERCSWDGWGAQPRPRSGLFGAASPLT
jgi:hypothetical protein